MPDALYIPGAPKREPLGRGGEAARWRSAGRGLPTRLSHSGVRTSHQPTAAVPWHSLSSPESRRQRDRTRDGCSAATEYRGTRRDSRPLRLWRNGTVAPSQARTLHLSASGPGGFIESRPELHTDLVMTTRGCSWKPLATGRLSQVGGVRTELRPCSITSVCSVRGPPVRQVSMSMHGPRTRRSSRQSMWSPIRQVGSASTGRPPSG